MVLYITDTDLSLHVEATRAADIHEIAVRSLNKSLQLVLLSLVFGRRIAEIVHLNHSLARIHHETDYPSEAAPTMLSMK